MRGGGEREGKVWFNCYIGVMIVKNYAHIHYLYIYTHSIAHKVFVWWVWLDVCDSSFAVGMQTMRRRALSGELPALLP